MDLTSLVHENLGGSGDPNIHLPQEVYLRESARFKNLRK
jgi:hypothetical protein